MILNRLCRWLTGRIGIIPTILTLVLFGAASLATDISYMYDDAGRLKSRHRSRDRYAAIYAYDSVGNLTGITRQALISQI